MHNVRTDGLLEKLEASRLMPIETTRVHQQVPTAGATTTGDDPSSENIACAYFSGLWGAARASETECGSHWWGQWGGAPL